MILNPAKIIVLLLSLAFWILLAFFIVGCANVSRVQEQEGWFPVGMTEDNQDFYNSKYNTLDNGYNDPNMNVKVFNTKY
jgi:hypothetical protein